VGGWENKIKEMSLTFQQKKQKTNKIPKTTKPFLLADPGPVTLSNKLLVNPIS
jgi:hypothetical protein